MSQAPGRPKGDSDARVRLIHAARQLFSQRSFQGVSTREIAREAEVDAAMIRYYFGSKSGLFEHMVRETMAPVLARFRQLSEADTPGDLATLMRVYYQAIGAHPGLPRLVLRVLREDEGSEPYRILLSIFQEVIQLSRRWVTQALVDSGLLRDGVDPNLARLSLVSLMVFPLLAPPVLVGQLGVTLNPEGLMALIPHHIKVLQQGILQPVEKSE
ncbi:TetR/AcrR family transcriptional regulator [Shewanella cyperi]|uniref:TetR/AcrR family transcriptional regulator n=1 Tax=Shewanella cyperi TaxID=2814292 RepID=UPI001A93AE9D|nr:TetR/AcrR family transcriptional regulator [Shewanella cyperi]QSX40832.1 TetR/AcrR family transcriptional regulator [Shewanella cyperi]